MGWGSSLPCSPTRGLCAQHPRRLGARGHLRTGPGVCKVRPCHHPTAVPLSTSSLRTHGTAALRVRLSPSTSLGHRHVCLLADSCCRVQIALVSWSLRRVPSDGHTVLWAQLLPERKVGSWSIAQGFCGGSDFQGACGQRAGVLGLGCLWRLPDAIPKRTAPSIRGRPAPRAGRMSSFQACLPLPDAGASAGTTPLRTGRRWGSPFALPPAHGAVGLAGPSLGFPAPGLS